MFLKSLLRERGAILEAFAAGQKATHEADSGESGTDHTVTVRAGLNYSAVVLTFHASEHLDRSKVPEPASRRGSRDPPNFLVAGNGIPITLALPLPFLIKGFCCGERC